MIVDFFNYSFLILNNMKKPKIPKILFIGDEEPELKSIQNEIYEDSSLEVKYIKNDNNIIAMISKLVINWKITRVVSNIVH